MQKVRIDKQTLLVVDSIYIYYLWTFNNMCLKISIPPQDLMSLIIDVWLYKDDIIP